VVVLVVVLASQVGVGVRQPGPPSNTGMAQILIICGRLMGKL